MKGCFAQVDFYSYYYNKVTPAISLYLGKGPDLSRFKLWWAIELRGYRGRLAQDQDADYKDDKVHQTDNEFGVSYNYPIIKNLTIMNQFNVRTVSSNMKYEGNYKYNYTVSNYSASFKPSV